MSDQCIESLPKPHTYAGARVRHPSIDSKLPTDTAWDAQIRMKGYLGETVFTVVTSGSIAAPFLALSGLLTAPAYQVLAHISHKLRLEPLCAKLPAYMQSTLLLRDFLVPGTKIEYGNV